MKPIKWGILGTGAIAKAFADALQETEGELVAVASPVSYTHLTLPTIYSV